MNKRIVIIGAGNVANNLASLLQGSAYTIVQVFSRSNNSAAALAQQCACSHTCNFGKITNAADIYIFCLSDDANMQYIPQFRHTAKLLIHTSGSMNPAVFAGLTADYGVLYPLQSLKKEIHIAAAQIPFLIEASNHESFKRIAAIAEAMGATYTAADTMQRTWAHISAVFACNFSNHMLAIASDIARKNNLDWKMLQPLIENTFNRSLHADPFTVQTGPAYRNEKSVMQKHSEMLHDGFNTYENLYKTISNSIFEMYKTNKKED
ncbi:MAG TPA: DUF2520 domain-containing protein [Bacteroidales bacterium]|nr:DUF2520 domain-containing protein [Bacteroidales bacterium]HQL69455.1 DUF2520 domain-containing protein [Bacteroidales bacterium]